MQISYGKPTSKGVTQLMYVGDDGSSATAPSYRTWLVWAGLFAAGWWFGKKSRG
ncbi:MAG TPA: hypothetical protein VMV18_11455 [bacterium]|nr:hypothetical protein [bacterium]